MRRGSRDQSLFDLYNRVASLINLPRVLLVYGTAPSCKPMGGLASKRSVCTSVCVVISFHNTCCGRSLRSAREMPFLLVEMLIGLEDTRIGRIQTTDSNQAMFEWKYPAQIFCPNSVSC